MQTVWDLFLKWKQNNEGYSWSDYYFTYWIKQKYSRESKQRNYKRNGDIIYSSHKARRDNKVVGVNIIWPERGELYLDGQYLKYKYDDGGFNYNTHVDKIRPFAFLRMWADNDMYLNADVPNLILDTEFKIDNNSVLNIKYG